MCPQYRRLALRSHVPSDLAREVYGVAGTIYIAPCRTVKDWLQDLADIGVLEWIGLEKFAVRDKKALERLSAQECRGHYFLVQDSSTTTSP